MKCIIRVEVYKDSRQIYLREVISMKTGGMKMQIDEIKDQIVMCVTKCGSWDGLQQTMEM